MVNPMWEEQVATLRVKEKEHVESQQYDMATSVATSISKLETTTPHTLKRMLDSQGTRFDILSSCDMLVAAMVQTDPSTTTELERAYKRMRS